MAASGESIDPMGLHQESSSAIDARPREAPSPGVPIAARKYERMKKAAKNRRVRKSERAQEDPSHKK